VASSSVEASRVLFIAVVFSVVAGEVLFFYWCFALSHCETNETLALRPAGRNPQRLSVLRIEQGRKLVTLQADPLRYPEPQTLNLRT
jgi:hypothetical protein